MMKMKIFLIFLLCIMRLKLSLQCIPYSKDIICTCSNFSVSCSGIQKNVSEVQNIFFNMSISYPEYLQIFDLNIEGLYFEPDFKFENISIKKMNMHSGLQTLSDDLLSGLSSSLVSLNLENNNIQEINNQPFSSLINLEELILDNNALLEIRRDVIYNLSKLEFLSISGNKLNELAPDILEYLPVIQTLILDDNDFSLLSKINFESSTLHKLQVRNSSVQGVLEKDLLSEMLQLIDADFSYNKITEVKPFALCRLKSLKFLNLSYNIIEEIQENAFSDLQNLSKLDLRNNRISVIKGTAFTNLSSLHFLDLSGNKLSVVLGDYTSHMLSLENLYLQNNEIKTVMPGTFYHSPNLKELNLEGNILECSCELLSVVDTLKLNTSVKSENIESLQCYKRNDYIFVTDYKPEESCDAPEEDFDYDEEDSSTHNASATLGSTVSDEETTSTVLSSVSTLLSETSDKPVVIHFTETSSQLYESSESDEDYDYYDLVTPTINFQNNTSSTEDPSKIGESSATTQVMVSFDSGFSQTTEKSTNAPSASSITSTTSAIGSTVISSSVCDLFEYFPEESMSSTLTKVSKQFLKNGEMFCLKWSITGSMPTKPSCVVKYLHPGGTKLEYMKCPGYLNEIKKWSSTENIYQFCIIIYDDSKKIAQSCDTLVKRTTESLTFVHPVSTALFSSSQATTETDELTYSKDSPSTIPLPASTELVPQPNSTVTFRIIAFDVHFINSNYSEIMWKVSKNEPVSICTLTLVVITQNFDHKKILNCKNNSYIIYNLDEHDTYDICLVSHHEFYQNVSLCRKHPSVPRLDAKAAKSKDKSYETFALMPLICLLILALLIIVIILFKKFHKKRLESDTYEVRVEEERAQRRLKSASQQRSSVRYSYTAKEQIDA